MAQGQQSNVQMKDKQLLLKKSLTKSQMDQEARNVKAEAKKKLVQKWDQPSIIESSPRCYVLGELDETPPWAGCL